MLGSGSLSNREQKPVISTIVREAPSIMGNQKLLILWVWMLLVATLCPWANCKRGGGFGSRGKGGGLGAKAPPSQSKGSSRQGLKLAGAAAAGAIGGAAIGYGLGSLGRPRYGYSEEDRRYYYPDGREYYNGSDWRYNKNAAGAERMASILISLATVTHIFMWN
nr:shadow of prion protein 2 [Misgurnus anguillicaudatus]